ncbi:uncharacterized protein LOC126753541 isoform X1 [Bactrocera neohumeralis]|uniref:uncharacterized protein LOC126753541 isoform X1 n=3 Tax=Bactrocera neohumeralis TaxID=98809 RepID=UPI002164FD20|nr:uncharacterized protein LOC126753541 isoform X1 [Bactrocera neohumeralis]
MKNEFANGCENASYLQNGFTHQGIPRENEEDPAAVFDSDDIYAHYAPSVRLLRIRKTITGSCGFHLTRTKWDPYPWVSAVDAHTAAEMSGLQPGDCVLEVNGEDVLGLRITDIAKLVQAKSGHVTLLLWNCGSDFKCDPESICCAPMPRTLQRLATIVQSILTIIECPVCLDSITPPVMQCQNGHLLCLDCRIRAERCPVCRDRYTPQRALIAEQIYAAITSAYNLCSGNEDKLRQKLYGPGAQCAAKVLTRRWRRAEAAKQTIDDCDAQTEVRTASIYAKRSWLKATQGSGAPSCAGQHVAAGGGQLGHFSFTNEIDTAAKVDAPMADTAAATEMCATKRASKRKKILMKLWHTRATSTENLSTSVTATSGQLNGKVIGMSSIDNGLTTSAGATTPATVTHVRVEPSSSRPHQPSPSPSISHRSARNAGSEVEMVLKNSQNHSTLSDNNGGAGDGGICEVVAATAAETKTPALLMRTQQQTGTRMAMTMPLNCATTRKTILNATTTSELAQVNAVPKLFTATPPPTAAPNTNDSTSQCENKQPAAEGEEAEKEEFEAVKEWINGKISPQQKHVQPHSQLSTWRLQQNQRQRQQLSPATSTTDSQSTATPPANVIAIAVERCPSMLRSQSPSQSIFNDYKNNKQHEICNCPSSTLLYVDKRRPASHTLTSSTEYLNKFCQPAATDAMLRTSAVLMQCSEDSLASSRKNSNNSIGGSCSSGSRSDITASAHSILTPASSLSSGVFSTSVDANDLAASIEACRARPDDATEITAITAHKNALLSPVDSLGQSSSITSSLRSLSSLTSSLFSSAASEDAPPPLMAATSTEACLAAAALNSTFSSSEQPAVTPSVAHLSSVAPAIIRKQLREAASGAFRCPCDGCDQKFNASSQLQRHVKVEHRLPILSFAGDERALVAVPLRQPLADVVLILEAGANESAHNSSNNNNANYNNNNNNIKTNNNTDHCNEDNALSDAWRGVDQKDNADCVGDPNAKDNKDVQDMHKAEQDMGGSSEDVYSRHIEKQLEQTRECWIRIKAQEASIDTTALLQATTAESADYVLKMRLSCIGDTTATAEGHTAAIELQLVLRSPSAAAVKARRSEGNIVAELKATTTKHS